MQGMGDASAYLKAMMNKYLSSCSIPTEYPLIYILSRQVFLIKIDPYNRDLRGKDNGILFFSEL